MKHDLFISYCRRDSDEVNALLAEMKAAIPDLNYWFDINGIESGDEFEHKIIAAIDNSAYVLFALSDNSINHSEWTKKEVNYAKNTGKKIIPVLLKGAKLSGWFLFTFGAIDCIDSTDESQKEKLYNNLSEWLGKKRALPQDEGPWIRPFKDDPVGGTTPIDTETFVNYYTQRFVSDLHMFFDVRNNLGDGSYPFVMEMQCGFTNLQRKRMVWDDLSHYDMFSVAVFYMSMCAQIVGRLYGYRQMENFMRASGWPMFLCGMGGLMHPIQVMRESELDPFRSDDGYIQTLLNAGKYLKKDFLDFMHKGTPCLNSQAHNVLVEVVDIDGLSEIFDQQEQLYCEWIRDRKARYESYYVETVI